MLNEGRAQLYARADILGKHRGRCRLPGEPFERWLSARLKTLQYGTNKGKQYYQITIGDPIEGTRSDNDGNA